MITVVNSETEDVKLCDAEENVVVKALLPSIKGL